MSSILRALRKLEDEKSDLGEGSVDLARDILKRSYDERRSSSIWGIVALAGVVLMLLAGWWLFSAKEEPPQQKVLAVQPTAQTIPATAIVIKTPSQQSRPVVVMPSRPVKNAEKQTVISSVVVATSIAIPELTVEEIVFVADPSARLAVINDLPVMQGTDIDGVRVVEILSDRVRFEFQGVRFEKFKKQNN